MSSSYGTNIKISIFGESHGAAVGVVIDGLPAGESVDMAELQRFLSRRTPGKNEYSTARREADVPQILSGVLNGKTCGAPLCAVIYNTDTRSADYAAVTNTPRPGHADYPAFVKHGGHNDFRGGGHFSARLTAPLCIAGGILMQLLNRRSVQIGAHIAEIDGCADARFDPIYVSGADFAAVAEKDFPVIDDSRGAEMRAIIAKAKSAGDSVGGIVECAVIGLAPGLGEPMFAGLENEIARTVFAVPAVKGIEFGAGFEAARKRGSENNDPFSIENGKITTTKNDHGGILGGLASGMPVIFRAAFKPTPSIAAEQETADLSRNENTKIAVSGRHDPCVVPRAVPCVEAAAAIAIAELLIR